MQELIGVKPPVWQELRARYLNPRHLPIAGIVLHDTGGTGTHTDTLYLAAPLDGSKVSVDFTVERDGNIWKLNPDLIQYCCNHAGRATTWRTFHNFQVNEATIGIELVQHAHLLTDPAYPEVQVRSVARLCAWLSVCFTLTAADITTHRQIITDGSRTDPRRFPFTSEHGFWAYYWQALGNNQTG